MYETYSFNGAPVSFTRDLVGGGERFGQDYIPFVRNTFGRVEKALEWCAGPGFIGFALLLHDLCEEVVLADVNPAAVAACEETIRRNDLTHARAVQSDSLDGLGPDDQFDLVVGNPPHGGTCEPSPQGISALIYNDPQWEVHARFYAAVPQHLKPGGHVVILENALLANARDFRDTIEKAGLEFVGSHPCPTNWEYFYIWSRLP